MKKVIIYSVFVLSLYACVNQQGNKNNNTENKTPQLITILNECIDRNPNWNQNDIIRDKFNDSLKIVLSKKLAEAQLLKEIPIELSEINEYEKGKFATNFQHWADTQDYKIGDRTFELNFNVIGIIPDSLISVLQNNKKYYLSGNFEKFLGGDFSNYIIGSVYTPLVKMEEEYGNIKVDVGIIIFNITNVEELK